MPSSISAKQIHKLIHNTSPKTWDGDIWYSNDNYELVGDLDYDLNPRACTLRPLINTKLENNGDDNVCTPVQTIPWSLVELAMLKSILSAWRNLRQNMCGEPPSKGSGSFCICAKSSLHTSDVQEGCDKGVLSASSCSFRHSWGAISLGKKRAVIIHTHSPYNSSVWPIRKPNGQRGLQLIIADQMPIPHL